MIVIDGATGQAVAIGEKVERQAGAWFKVATVADWWFRARVSVHTDRGVRHRWIPVTVRRTNFGRQRVAVYPP